LELLINFGDFPVCKHYSLIPFEVKPKWPVKLYVCNSCGLTQLKDSCPAEVLYENYVTLSSWKFQPHADYQIDIIDNLKGLSKDSQIIEIGSNDGIYLEKLKNIGYSNLLGIEPSIDGFNSSIEKGIPTINDYLSIPFAEELVKKNNQYDLLISRQVFEHTSNLKEIAESINILLKDGGYVLIEVPNFASYMDNRDYGLWEEHVNWFTTDTLKVFLKKAGIEVIREEIFLFSGEGIFIIGKKEKSHIVDKIYLSALLKKNEAYKDNFIEMKSFFHSYLSNEKTKGKKIAAYGAGNRLFCLINFFDLSNYIDIIVDDQFEKQGFYMPGTSIKISSSDELLKNSMDICLLSVNTECEEKVIAKHQEWLLNGGIFHSVNPPSNKLIPGWILAK
jgi:SAM-dependent methyltransferase